MKRFTVFFDRDETGSWVAQVKEAPATITQGRTLAETRRRIREALEVVLNSSLVRHAAFIEDIRLPPAARRALRTLALSRARLDREKHRMSEATDAAISSLLEGMKLSVRDAGEFLGLSHQRIHQLKAGSGRGAKPRERASTPSAV